MTRCLALVVLLASPAAPLSAQTQAPTAPIPGGAPSAPLRPQVPARDNQQTTGTAIIRGRVLAADTAEPMRRAVVRASSPDLRDARLTTTDAEGRYELKDLPAGRYTINASKGSYVGLTYGQMRPFEPGKPLDIADGQTVEKVDFSLPHGAVVTGRVVDEFGEALADVQVAAMRSMNQGGRRRMVSNGRPAMTNDIGEFRIFGLPPGQYFISATLRANMSFGAQSDDRSGYAATYYPGTANQADAQRLDVGIGQTLSQIDIALLPTRTARVSGTVVDSQGRPQAGGSVTVVQRSTTMAMVSGFGPIRPDGTFTVNGLAPGDYTLRASAGTPDMAELAIEQISISGDDITGVHLAMTRPSTLTGRIVFNDSTAARSVRAAMLSLAAMPKTSDDIMPFGPFGGVGPPRANDDFTFEIKSQPGPSLVRMMSTPPGWTLKAVRVNGADVTDEGFEVKANEDMSGIEIELTNHQSALMGLVTNSRGEAVKDYSLLLFAQDRERWGPGTRYMRTARPDQNGRFNTIGLPAGEYYAIALDYMESGDATDPEFLDRVQPKADRFSLGDGETKSLDLKVSSLGDR